MKHGRPGVAISLVTILTGTLAGALPVRPAAAALPLVLGGTLQAAIPRGPWSEGVLALAPGVSWDLGVALRPLPLTVGIDAGFAVSEWSSEQQPLELSLPSGSLGHVDTSVERHGVMLLGHVYARLQPHSGRVRPFVEALLGGKRLQTEVEVQNPWSDDQPLARETTFAGHTWSSGLGAGIDLWRLHDSTGAAAAVTFGARYLRGGAIDFGPQGPWPSLPSGRRRFDTRRTDTLIVYLGVRGTPHRAR